MCIQTTIDLRHQLSNCKSDNNGYSVENKTDAQLSVISEVYLKK